MLNDKFINVKEFHQHLFGCCSLSVYSEGIGSAVFNELHAADPIAFWDKGAVNEPSVLLDLIEDSGVDLADACVFLRLRPFVRV